MRLLRENRRNIIPVSNEDPQDTLARASKVLETALPGVWAVYVYGSFARGDAWAQSDLDLAVLLAPRARIPDRLGLVAEISREVGREVDLVDLREAGLDLIHEVLRDGRQLLVRRRADVLEWEAERMSDYEDFNPRRSDIVDLYLRGPLRRRTS